MTILINPCDGCGYLQPSVPMWEHPFLFYAVVAIGIVALMRAYRKIEWSKPI